MPILSTAVGAVGDLAKDVGALSPTSIDAEKKRRDLAELEKKEKKRKEQAEVDILVAKYKLRAGDDDDEEIGIDGEEVVKKRKPFVDTTWFNIVVGFVIGANALTIGFETDAKSRGEGAGAMWFLIELVFCVIFSAELGARLWFHRCNFFFIPGMKWWNRSDFTIVCIALADTLVLTPLGSGGTVKFVSMLRFARLLRLIRLIRLFKIFKELWLVASGLIESLKTLTWVCLMLFILCYVFGIFMTVTVGQNDELYDNYFVVGPCGDICNEGSPTECSDCKRAYQHQEPFDHEVYFKTVMMSVFTLLQVLTLDGWSEGIARHVLHEQGWQIIFFVIFIALGSFGLLNIIIGVVVENTLSTSEKDNNFVRKRKERDRQNVLSQLREIFEYADADGSGTLTIDEVKNALDKPEVHTNLKKIEFPVENPERIFDLLDYSNAKELSIDEFITGCMRHEGEAKSKDLLAAQVALDTMRRHYDSLQEEMDMFNEKLRLLETTAESLIDHGEHVFLNAQEYRMRHPSMRENQPVQLSDYRLNTAPWERKIEVQAPPPVPSGWEVARRSDGTLDYLQLQMLQDKKRQAEESAMAISDVEHDGPEALQDSFDNSNRSPNLALQDIPGAITDIGPEAGAIVPRRN